LEHLQGKGGEGCDKPEPGHLISGKLHNSRGQGDGLKIVAQAEDLAFELEIGHGSGLEYPVTVHKSPAGEAQATMRFPFSDRVLESRLQDLQATLRGARGRHRSEPPAEALGQALFDALFRGEVGSLYDRCWRQAAEQGQVLRLRLRIQAPELVAVPWEYLYDARLGEYLCLSHTSIVRYHELPRSSQTSTVTPPLRILGMLAGSPERPAADAKSARKCLEEATNHLQALELVKLEWVKGGTWRHLRQALGSDDWHVFYFVGDGGLEQKGGESYLVLEGEDGRAEPFSMARLGRLLASRESLQLVWLSTGAGTRDGERDRFYSMANGLLQRGIPAVLTLQQEMVRSAAEAFAEAFYAAVAATMSLDLAVAKARMATLVEASATPAWGTPVLHTVLPDMRLFDRETLAESACRRGDEALAADEFERSTTQYMLAAEMGAEAIDEAKVALARDASRTVRDAEELLSWSEGNAESLADELLKVSESLEGLQQRLPDSQAIRVLRNRMEDKASSLRDLLWQDGQQMMRRRTIGLTLAGQYRQMEESVRLLEKATQLDQEDNPALREDLDKAMRRLRYLENAQAQAKGEQGRRRRRITILGAVVAIVLLLSCLAAVMAGAPGLFGLLEKPTSVADVPTGQSTEPVVPATDSGATAPDATAELPPSPTTQPTLAPAITTTGPLASTDTPLPIDTASPAGASSPSREPRPSSMNLCRTILDL
jgi:hypothetical protein